MNNQKGGTLVFTIIIIVVLSIISMSIITSTYVRTRTIIAKLDESYEKLQLENEMYNSINLCIGKSEDQIELILKDYKKDNLEITINKFENNVLEFNIQIKDSSTIRKCVVEFSLDENYIINGYSIMQTGIIG
ncbi:MAG: hypothetical protein ACI32E_06170 [Bacilli bacterium]